MCEYCWFRLAQRNSCKAASTASWRVTNLSLTANETYFLNFDSIGLLGLVMLEGESTTIWKTTYHRPFRDPVVQADVLLRRGMRACNSADVVLMSCAGCSTACFSSIYRYKAFSNYHQMPYTSENLFY